MPVETASEEQDGSAYLVPQRKARHPGETPVERRQYEPGDGAHFHPDEDNQIGARLATTAGSPETFGQQRRIFVVEP